MCPKIIENAPGQVFDPVAPLILIFITSLSIQKINKSYFVDYLISSLHRQVKIR